MEARPIAVSWRPVDGPAVRGLAVAIARTALLAGVYVAAAKAAFALAFVHTSIAPIWPPSGIALAAVLLFGRRAVHGVLLGAFLFNASTPVPLWVSAAMGVGNTAEAVVGAWLLRRAGFRRAIDRVRDVLALAGLGALVSTALSASVGVGSLWLSGILPDTQVWVGWAIWWFGDAAGMLTVAPLLLLASTRRHWRRPEPGRVLEAAALAATLGLIVQAGLTERVARPFLVFPALVWAAVRFRQAGAAVASLFVSVVVVWLTLHDRGPFVEPSLTQSLLLTQAATGAVMATSLALAAQTLGRREHQLAEAHAQAELSRRLQNGLLPVLSLHDPALLLRTRYQPGQRRGLVLSGHGPRGLLDGLDKVLVANRPSEEMFTTVCCTWISPDRTRVTVAPAGHPPPLLVSGGQVRVEELPGGPALGILDHGYEWEARTLEVGDGWTLLCYTDGLVEGLRAPGSVER